MKTARFRREPLFTVATPYGGALQVVLYRDTWDYHIAMDRKMPGLQDVTKATLLAPSVIVRGTTLQATWLT